MKAIHSFYFWWIGKQNNVKQFLLDDIDERQTGHQEKVVDEEKSTSVFDDTFESLQRNTQPTGGFTTEFNVPHVNFLSTDLRHTHVNIA